MPQKFRDAGLIWPTLLAIPALAILLGLGTWQWQRMHWKKGLLHKMEAAASAPPVALKELFAEATEGGKLDLDKLRFRQVETRMHGVTTDQLFVWNPQPRMPAWTVIRAWPFFEEIAGFDHALVIVGWVSATDRAELTPMAGTTVLPKLVGRLRLDMPNASAPPPVLPRKEWFTRDLKSMAAYVNAQPNMKDRPARFLPVFIEAAGDGSKILRPNASKITLSNRHFEYALTWWGLALTLVGVYGAFVWSRLFQSKSRA